MDALGGICILHILVAGRLPGTQPGTIVGT